METVRIRLVFDERKLLNKSQIKNGLKRSWILLKPHLHTISDFSSYLLDSFPLHHSCPHGLILSMDGFILPPFESTSVLKDKDVVRVKKKEGHVTGNDKLQSVHMNVNECSDDFKNEDETYVSLQLEDTLNGRSNKKTVCKKRRAMDKLCGSKAKKNSSSSTARYLLAPQDLQQTRPQQNQSFQRDVILPEKSLVKKHKSSNGHSGTKKNKDKSQLMGEQVKLKLKAPKEKVQQQRVEKINRNLPDNNYFQDCEQVADSCDDDEMVPVVTRPGHIRFEPLGRVANWSVHPAQTSMETLRWKAKKKEQKRGKEKYLSWRSNCNDYQGGSSTLQVTKDPTTLNGPVDFNKLRPCASLPKRGDIIAYRLIELSSTWTPELSSFRVGKVSWYKPEANQIVLLPVPEYPFVFKVVNGESATQVDTYPYGKDGSLKAHYSSLVDIRIVKRGNSNCFDAAAANVSKVSHTNQSWSKWESRVSAQENRNENSWDKILQALSTKKTEWSEEVGWSRVEKKAHGS